MEKEQTKNEKSKKEKKDIKKTLKSVLALVLVAVISIAGTLAFLQKKTNPTKNVFLGSAGIDLTVEEPNYDDDKAESYSPGSTITKDPLLVNRTETDDCYEWVAMKVSYQSLTEVNVNGMTDDEKAALYQFGSKYYNVTALTADQIKNVIKPIEFNGDSDTTLTDKKDWYLLDDGSAGLVDASGNDIANSKNTYIIYMYKKRLDPISDADKDKINSNQIADIAAATKTTALFDKVEVRSPMYQFDNTDFDGSGNPVDADKKIDNTAVANFPKFRIDIEGAAVKDEGYTYVYDSNDNGDLDASETVTCIEHFSKPKDANSNTNAADLKTIQNELLKLLGSSHTMP